MWLARNKDGALVLYYKKPKAKNGYYLSQDGKYFHVDIKYAKKLKFEHGPKEVDLIFL